VGDPPGRVQGSSTPQGEDGELQDLDSPCPQAPASLSPTPRSDGFPGRPQNHRRTVHGHPFALVGGGARKDTVIARPMQMVEVDFDANNPVIGWPTATTSTTARAA